MLPRTLLLLSRGLTTQHGHYPVQSLRPTDLCVIIAGSVATSRGFVVGASRMSDVAMPPMNEMKWETDTATANDSTRLRPAALKLRWIPLTSPEIPANNVADLPPRSAVLPHLYAP